ncbi:methylmalonyl-CoA mutase [Stappia sp. F7233]|uniref:methylmalonyl-CoA mutase n=1 Tax=Stappia albiluteola TaxID=2758565 RepID=A0A839AJF2_9HYPH|nr:methylmalonyl-CoA mutase family protein [Stappia albiluteola]MBA5779084.1 methylmalonyl-CoA mutase [Stappia albiluteola]
MAGSEFTLPREFLDFDSGDWMAAVDKALKGAPFDRLRTRTLDGLPIEPLYPRAGNARPQAGRAAGEPWVVMQRIDHPAPKAARELILADLQGGANGIELVFSSSTRARGNGLVADTLDRFSIMLEGIHPELIQVRLDAGYETAAALALFLALVEGRGLDPAKLDIVCSADYVGKLAATGQLRTALSVLQARLGDLAHRSVERGMIIPIVNCDGRHWHDGGASEAQELAFTFATALEYLRALDRAGIDAEVMPRLIGFTLVADADQFATLAKARAARRMWAAILEAAQLPATPMRLHMETSWRMMSRRDPWVNMLRTTIAAFAAGVGGADSVTVLPFTAPLGLPDAFARRIARNTQTILIEEANLHKVADPGAGSGAVEAFTTELCEAAWRLMQEVEAEDGIVSTLMAKTVQQKIATVTAARRAEIAARRHRITGTSAFPDIRERPVEVLAVSPDDLGTAGRRVDLPPPGRGEHQAAVEAALRNGASMADILVSRPVSTGLTTTAIAPHRDSEPFEVLRDAADEAVRRPTVFLATLGALSQFTARATWTKNFFETGGIEAVGGDVYGDLDAALAGWKASGASLVCLCSSDAVYATQGEEAAERFAAGGAAGLYLAGRPKDLMPALAAAGVATFVYEGCDALHVLRTAHQRLGLAPKAA